MTRVTDAIPKCKQYESVMSTGVYYDGVASMRQAWEVAVVDDNKTITELGAWLANWRESKKGSPDAFTQPSISLELTERYGDGWSQGLLSKVENGRVDFSGWPGSRLYILLSAYRVPPALMLELAKRFGLERLTRYIAERQETYGVREGPRVKYRGKIAAGQLSESFAEDETVSVGGVPDWVVERFNLDEVFAVTVNGNSMLSPEAAETIPEGSTVFLHSRGRPSNGDIICAYLPAHDQTVLKRWVDGNGYAVLSSHNSDHKPIVVHGDEVIILQGVYITHTPRPRRFR